MKNQLKIILITLGVIALMIITGMGVSSWKEYKLVKENTLRVESEMRFKQKVVEAIKLEKKLDTLTSEISAKQKLIDELENNPKIIIRNNEASHMDINKLNAYNSILLFSTNASKYESNRGGRYSLGRFDKHN